MNNCTVLASQTYFSFRDRRLNVSISITAKSPMGLVNPSEDIDDGTPHQSPGFFAGVRRIETGT
jgi:hypothetical protein